MTRPNILIFMVDQLNGTLFPDGPTDWLVTPNLRALAARSTRFANAYTASPLCAPARASFMSGQMTRRTRVYDNAAEFASDIPTYAHHLRRAGYQTCLSGKMHFVGPDQLHGFEERLTTDVYPADLAWTPDWTKPDTRIDHWYHNMDAVRQAGTAMTTFQYDYDDEAVFLARRRIFDHTMAGDAPLAMVVSLIHPHDPYVARPEFTGRRIVTDVFLNDLVPFIDWSFFFTAWELKGKYPAEDILVGLMMAIGLQPPTSVLPEQRKILADCAKLFKSDAMFLLLSNFTGLKLHPLAPEDDDDAEEKSDDEKPEPKEEKSPKASSSKASPEPSPEKEKKEPEPKCSLEFR